MRFEEMDFKKDYEIITAFDDPMLLVQKVLSGKWSVYILYMLKEGSLRFNEIHRRMPGTMTHTTLIRQLRTLEKMDMIVRIDHEGLPQRVDYCLTDLGKSFIPVLDTIIKWAENFSADQ